MGRIRRVQAIGDAAPRERVGEPVIDVAVVRLVLADDLDDIAQDRVVGQLPVVPVYTSGAKIEGIKPIWKGTIEVGDRADVDAAIAHEKTVGVDFVKITDSTIDPKLFLYAVSRARAAGRRVSGHIPLQDTVGQAVDAGISSIEHMDYAYKAGVKTRSASTILRVDPARAIPSFAR